MSFNVSTSKTTDKILLSDGWWCDICVAEFIELYRLPHEYGEKLIVDHLSLARTWVVSQLVLWREQKEAEGFTSLESIKIHGFAGEGARLFKRAVFCHAKALLLGQFATMERRDAAKNDAKEAPETAERFYAWSQNAISDLLGKNRIMAVSL